MINAKLMTCGLCQSFYADPRQIPCSHSFCFDCISGRFDEETLTLICPKCEKIHHYNSFEEFQNRCMRDGFLASMVTQFKKNQSRSSTVPFASSSRSPSTVSSTPIPPPLVTQELNNNNNYSYHEPSSSERSTPSQRPASVSQPSKPPALFAKCQSCNIRGELTVCSHCENVICLKCIDEHQSVINKDVKREWEICKTKFEKMREQSIQFDQDEAEVNSRARHLQTLISKQSGQLLQTVDNHKNAYIDMIEKHRRTYKQSFAHEQVVDEYESIDKRLEDLFRTGNITADNLNDFLFEIEHLESRLDNLHKLFDPNQLKFPVLTLDEQITPSLLFGTLEFANLNTELPTTTRIDPYSTPITNGYIDRPLMKLDDEDYVMIDPSSKLEPNSSAIPTVQRKKLLWQIDYFSVPYYVRTHENHLYVCDKYGSLAVYKLNHPQKPSLIREMKLFKDTPTSTVIDEDQTIIDSFTVYKLWLIVFKRKKNELHGTIYLFTHDGKPIPNGKCPHNYPSRELTIDTEKNILWSLDQKHLSLFYYDLPDSKCNNPEEYLQNRQLHVQFSKPFAPIHISVNNNVLAVLDKNRQAVHVYDKKNRQKIYEHVNMYNSLTHFCWDMALFSDNSLLIKLDEMSSLKSGPSKHVYLQLDTTKQHHIIGIIEEIDAYGMMITPTDEILIGVRVNTKGILKCYI